ncbi:hypothetical protein [Romboutsia lituseburensis]|uniref:hypothetical protein n=1 Tax=Romboutsia lituseburensis TaxID=1537 RepID=UPI00215A1A8D|nr:hypothetical protein [Romboutsia lituseburensis]MCR8745756.1 hypothetical protein [Romboutsia lituseburensis]
MQKKQLKIIAIILSLVIITGAIQPSNVYALLNDKGIEKSMEKELQNNLQNDNIHVENLDFVDNNFTVDISIDTIDKDTIDTKLEIEPGSDEITIISEEVSESGQIVTNKYTTTVEEINKNEGDITFINEDETKEYIYNKYSGYASNPLAIPLGLEIGAAAWALLVKYGHVIVALGIAFVLDSKAPKSKKYNHYMAKLSNGNLYIGKGLTRAEATAQMMIERDVWSHTSDLAKKVAVAVSKSGQGINEVDKDKKGKPKKGYYYHWHPKERKPKAHSFYGKPVA